MCVIDEALLYLDHPTRYSIYVEMKLVIELVMSEIREFRAFLSYAHHDRKTDPEMIELLTTALENHVNAKLMNARLSIWYDHELKLGNIWSDRIDSRIQQSEVFILLLSPQ